ncbi:molybdenum dehydrogenase [Clostridium sp. P21]|uniref:Molybdenum dehydrogenase n=1 Tax=Clostridium muellerianum TaxID=2716538 RepID=A0A7Y0ED87_9CLOT|nr:XdhC/CoxI family protein [Clostridium muellerianum]NMM61236.1 molybdenum dehydrogenase [Clostridium muellerianum]
MQDIYETVNEFLDRKQEFVLATILEKSESTPREEGVKMIIKKDLSIVGTIGGGIFEAMAVKLSLKVFENKASIVKKFSLNDESARTCGGDIKLLLEYISYDENKIIDLYKNILELRKKGVKFAIVTKIPEEEIYVKVLNRWICGESLFYGEEDDTVQLIFRKIRENFKNVAIENITLEKELYLIEPILNCETLYIVGAGHVAQKITQITNMLDFKTIIVDDREDFANKQRFKGVEDIKVIPSFEEVLKYINVDNSSYIIIVTRGHAYDREVLSQILKTDAKYIGMIGSRKKREFIYNCLLSEGYTLEDLQRVHSPIGMSIFAKTPEEIAVSIVAELIKVKREPFNEKK